MVEIIQKKILKIPRRLVDKRLDSALFLLMREKYPESGLSREILSRRMRAGEITLNGMTVSPNHIVKLHDSVEVQEENLFTKITSLTIRHDIRIPILYEDKNLIVLDKPAGIQMHPAGSQDRDTVAHFIVTIHPELDKIGDDPLRPGIVHRLDRETSGVVVIAKTSEVFNELKRLFQNRSIKKTYVALVHGHMPATSGCIERSLERTSGTLKRRVVIDGQERAQGVREAVTLYQVIARYPDFDLVIVTPQTGRTHQIRVHLASAGCSIVGDKLYASRPMRRQDTNAFIQRHMLHAWQLQFTLFGEAYALQSPLPTDFRQILQDIDENREAGYDDEALKSLVSE
ncbi:MAG: RluA family pseudouridine synthase [Minisyncoccota bacterium]